MKVLSIDLMKKQKGIFLYKLSTIIKITNNLKTAECTGSGNERFALIDGPVNKKGSWIRFKVEKLKNWVGFGLAIRNNIVSKKFQFLCN